MWFIFMHHQLAFTTFHNNHGLLLRLKMPENAVATLDQISVYLAVIKPLVFCCPQLTTWPIISKRNGRLHHVFYCFSGL